MAKLKYSPQLTSTPNDSTMQQVLLSRSPISPISILQSKKIGQKKRPKNLKRRTFTMKKSSKRKSFNSTLKKIAPSLISNGIKLNKCFELRLINLIDLKQKLK